jgi:hypothetical protein
MNTENLTPKQIQEVIFAEIEKGTAIDIIKATLKQQGKNPEGYYFTTAAKHNQTVNAPKEPASKISGMQVFWIVLSIVFLLIRVARCNSRM